MLCILEQMFQALCQQRGEVGCLHRTVCWLGEEVSLRVTPLGTPELPGGAHLAYGDAVLVSVRGSQGDDVAYLGTIL